MFTPEVFYGLGALLLLAVLIWAVSRNKGRNRANDAITEAATREEYDHPETYEETRRELNRRVRPS